ncbi:MAG: hypothetical protein MHPSP_001668, partial [Paramarteilia canceri]
QQYLKKAILLFKSLKNRSEKKYSTLYAEMIAKHYYMNGDGNETIVYLKELCDILQSNEDKNKLLEAKLKLSKINSEKKHWTESNRV